jgi:O-succinylhomoserine sulfhydrylase
LDVIHVGIISNNLGDSKSIYTHPASTTHQRLSERQKGLLSITTGLIRFSVGQEDSGDLIANILQALE